MDLENFDQTVDLDCSAGVWHGTTRKYERYDKIEAISNSVKKSGLKAGFIIPTHCTAPPSLTS